MNRADNLTVICELTVLDNVGSLKCHNPIGLHDLLQGQLYFFSLLLLLRFCQCLEYTASNVRANDELQKI
jgi:hypothetical protein